MRSTSYLYKQIEPVAKTMFNPPKSVSDSEKRTSGQGGPRLRSCLKLSVAILIAGAVLALDMKTDHRLDLAMAHADDDGGGKGGNARGGGDGPGDDDLRKARPLLRFDIFRKRTRPARNVVGKARTEEPGVLIAAGLSAETIDRLVRSGYSVIERKTLALAGGEVVKLKIPARKTLANARDEVNRAQPDATLDYNHYYRPESSGCGDGRCLVRHLAGWPAPGSRELACKPTQPIGLIDTRINAAHPSLVDSRITIIKLDSEAEAESAARHGTAVAALLVGKGDIAGLLPDWNLIAVDAFRKGDIANSFDLIEAIEILAARNVGVINMSLSGPENRLLESVLERAAAKNIVLVAAAGNDGPRARPAFPAAYPDVIAATAVDRDKKAYRRAAQGDHVDIAAPGVGVWTAASVSGLRPRTGTSFAAPFVAAAAAMIKSAHPDFTNEQVEDVLQNQAEDLGAPGRDPVFGWGLLDISTLCRS